MRITRSERDNRVKGVLGTGLVCFGLIVTVGLVTPTSQVSGAVDSASPPPNVLIQRTGGTTGSVRFNPTRITVRARMSCGLSFTIRSKLTSGEQIYEPGLGRSIYVEPEGQKRMCVVSGAPSFELILGGNRRPSRTNETLHVTVIANGS